MAKISAPQDILDAQQRGAVGWLPTVEHLSMAPHLHQVDVLYGIGVRLAGLTYMRKSVIGDGQYERTDCGLSDFGIEVVRRMNDLGMAIDLSHAGRRPRSKRSSARGCPSLFSHNAAYPIDRPAARAPTRSCRRAPRRAACCA